MVWNALAMQYRLGFQASSDHISTHISYAIALAEEPTRPAILDAFRRRHCYAATDNIIMDVRSDEHLMGDEFTASGPVKLKVIVHGTGPVAQVDIIKDFKVRLFDRAQERAGRLRVDRRRTGPPDRPELVLRAGDPDRRRARLGQPDLGPHSVNFECPIPESVIYDSDRVQYKLGLRLPALDF